MDERAQEILDSMGVDAEQVSLPKMGSKVTMPKVVAETYKANWPTRSTGVSSFQKALMAGEEEGEGGEEENGAHEEEEGMVEDEE